ncbi:MAG: Lrp/AsnC ligand binding domain-containing protein [Candidatus Nanoarchaeia archaeon]
MITAFVLLKVKRGGELNITDSIKKMSEVQDVSLLYGEYDAIIKVKTKTMESLQDFLVNKLRRIDGVDKTATLISNNLV